MSRTRTKKQTAKKPSWRDTPEFVILKNAPVFKFLPKPQSLNPNASVMERAAQGDQEAILVTESYKFVSAVIEVAA